MAAKEESPDGQSAPPASPDRPASPCPDPEDPRVGIAPGRRDDAGDKEHPATLESSEDDGYGIVQEPIHEQQQQQQRYREPQDPEKTSSRRPSSAFAHTNAVVPRAQRRGLLGRLTLIPEVERPYEYKNSTKWTITAIVALAAAAAPMGSGIFLPALPSMTVDLGASETVTNLTISFYMLAMSIFPLWWHVARSSFSETLGRRTVYIVSFSLFLVFSICSALSVNIAMLLVMRILGGGASASVQAVGAGTIADIWQPANRGRAMGIFYLGPLVGPLCAPIIGGALTEGFGWRATMWFLTIYGG
ncbi:hypothetical protein VTH06DRAFT_8825, partial [Thermothelomyces fergusii]